MKFKKVYKIAALLVLYVVLQSRSGGPGSVQNLQVTGAPGSTGNAGTCGNTGCHAGGSFNPALSIQLLDGANPVVKYEPGKSYTLRVTNTPGSGTPPRFGFQAVALNAANAQTGDWGAPGAGKQVVTLSSRKYIEHSAPASTGTFEMPWIAPASGAGTVTFYSASTAANNNGAASGDAVASTSLAVEEGAINNTSTLQKEYASLLVLPNPVNDMLNLQITSRTAGNHKIRIIDVNGAVLKEAPASLQVGVNRAEIPVSDLTPGLYIVQLCGDEHMAAVQMLKL